MTWRRLALALFAAAAVLVAWMYPQLSEPMASQFNMAGEPRRWATRLSFVSTFLAVAGLVNLLFLGGIARVLTRLEAPRFNVPNREYWLATPERRVRAIGLLDCFLCKAAVFANVITLLSLHLVAQGNQVPVAFEIPAAWIGPLLLATVLGGVGWLLVLAYRDFAVPERGSEAIKR